MNKLILIKKYKYSAVALEENDELCEFYYEYPDEAFLGNIYKGKIERVINGMETAFVDIGLDKNAFCHLETNVINAGKFFSSTYHSDKPLLYFKNGDIIMCQITKDAVGNKSYTVTPNIKLTGIYLIMMPFNDNIIVSHKITNEDDKNSLIERVNKFKNNEYGYIIRTAANGATDEDLKNEIESLNNIWNNIKNKYNGSKVGTILYQECNLISKTLRDIYNQKIDKIYINNKEIINIIKNTIHDFDKIENKIVLSDDYALTNKYSLSYFKSLLIDKKIMLKSGGYLIIDITEALTVIDVNSGSFIGDKSLEETAYSINVEAATELARQIRIRNIGGIIIVDFVDMKEEEHKQGVLTTLTNAFIKDRIRTEVVEMTKLGLVEITRRRTVNCLFNKIIKNCDKCKGTGQILNDKGLILDIFHNIIFEFSKAIKPTKVNLEISKDFDNVIEEYKKNDNTYPDVINEFKINIIINDNLEYDKYKLNFVY
jgi:ribonuclease G